MNRLTVAELGYVSVFQIDDQQITVVNLYQRFFKSQQSDEFPANNRLLIVQNSRQELFGIPVADTPKLDRDSLIPGPQLTGGLSTGGHFRDRQSCRRVSPS